jgi:hypothetical protein
MSQFLEPNFLSNRRILIFGVNRIQSRPTFDQIKRIHKLYDELCTYVDEVFCLSFGDFLLFEQLAPRLSSKIKFVQDSQLLPRFQELVNKRGHKDFLKQYWQFVCCVNDGKFEFLLEEPFRKIDLDPDTVNHIYHLVTPELALEKLKEIK